MLGGLAAPKFLLPHFSYVFPERVFDMGSVPRNSRKQAMLRRQLAQDLPITVFRFGPVPIAPDKPVPHFPDAARDEVDCEPVLMCTLPRRHFRGAFGEKVVLPAGTAETLERFHKELRLVGLIGQGEVLRQSAKCPSHFRVQVGNRKLTSFDIHEGSSLFEHLRGTAETPGGERATQLRCREPEGVSKLIQSLEYETTRKGANGKPYVHDKRPKARREAPT